MAVRQSTGADVVREFIKDFNARDFDAASKLVKGGKSVPALMDELKRSDLKIEVVSATDEETTGDSARVVVIFKVTGSGETTQNMKDTVKLGKGPNGLLILPGNGVNEMSISALVTLFAAPEEVMARAREAAQATVCLSNLKQVALGILLLANDHDDKLATSNAKWVTDLQPYLRNKKVFACPKNPGEAVSYTFNDRLRNVQQGSIDQPASTVLAYEGHHGVLDFRHNDRACVAFADGHVKLVGKEGARTLVWTAHPAQKAP